MIYENRANFIKNVLANMPADWLKLTTYRLDIYNETLAKVDFLNHFEKLADSGREDLRKELEVLPTAFDYIRLGHPLSCILEWLIAKKLNLNVENVISFSSQSMPILSVLRKNLLENIHTQILYQNVLPKHFEAETLKSVYGYKFDLIKINNISEVSSFKGSTIFVTEFDNIKLEKNIDFVVNISEQFGSIILVNEHTSKNYISEIQHVRRRESIAMTPSNSLAVIKNFVGLNTEETVNHDHNKISLINTIQEITNTTSPVCIGSSGLSVQFAIMMGLIHEAQTSHVGKKVKFIVPPNCYGGTNDQARRVAACLSNVEIIDLAVDGGQDMVESIEKILDQVASVDAAPFIIAEIPTNPRVEVPHLNKLRETLGKVRKTLNGKDAIAPVFILDQTFCPNVKFLGEGDYLSSVKTISYVSGSKFPSGGLCTAGYCVSNKSAEYLMTYVDQHLKLCNNEATDQQIMILENQMPSMNDRISKAYKNTRAFVSYIHEILPAAKINFVSESLAAESFTPSVFSLDLPTKGNTKEEKESHKRELNLLLINLMIKEIPQESKFCVSYGQLKGCYWTIPATSTQGTTKEGDKDYIVRVSLSPDFNLELHKKVFSQFCKEFIHN